MVTRKVSKVVEPESTLEGAGVVLKRSIATEEVNYIDPFLLFDHFGSDNSDDYIAGFPMHPHRGIETVTYMIGGMVKHRDTTGKSGVIRAGDVQWMTAGSGIMHEEMPRVEGGRVDGFQLWVNLPAKEKMIAPRYQGIAAQEIPTIETEDGTIVKIIAGSLNEIDGAVKDIAADPTYLDVLLKPAARFDHTIPSTHTAFAYLFRGSGWFEKDGDLVTSPRLIIFDEGEDVEIRASSGGARFLLVSGKPTNEPIVRYGPFVMNTQEEIKQALMELKLGTFIK